MKYFIGQRIEVGEGVLAALDKFTNIRNQIREDIRVTSIELLCPDNPDIAGPRHCLCVNSKEEIVYLTSPGKSRNLKPAKGTNCIPLDQAAPLIMGDALASIMENVIPQVLETLFPGLSEFMWEYKGEERVITITGLKENVMEGLPISPTIFGGNA